MLTVELYEYGLRDVLAMIKKDLKSVVGREYSKKEKDEMIYKALGAVNALDDMILVWDTSTDDEPDK